MSWGTGTAGWLYRAITEYIFGVKAVKGGLEIKPCFPKLWNGAKVTRFFRGATYEIELKRGEENKVFVNGEPICGNVLPVAKCGEIYSVKVLYR